ncbi:hypothetical protein DXG01_004825 [Tephrocybe rancida]|nr:hypothetical protein DXG01_004825 [Tephrocybe rancida]
MASNEGRGDIRNVITSFISWLGRLLANFFYRSQPLEELPIVTSGSQQTMALLEAFRAEDHGAQGRSLLLPAYEIEIDCDLLASSHGSAHARTLARRHHPEEPNTDLQSERRIRSATTPISFGRALKQTNVVAVAREKPLSNYPTGFRWTAPITRPEDWEQPQVKATPTIRPAANINADTGIGDLGMRRGFKGKPLIFTPPATDSMWSRSSLFLSLPRGFNFSPRSSSVTSLDGAPSSPRTPLEAVANRMRSVSVSVVSWSSSSKPPVPTLNEIPQDLQDLYDTTDPFASTGDTFFVLSSDPDDVPAPDLSNFGLYRRCGMVTRKQSCIGQKNAPSLEGLHKAFVNARMKTTIYDMSTADVVHVPARMAIPVAQIAAAAAAAASLRVPAGQDTGEAATSPTIVLTPTTPPVRELADENKEQFGENLSVANLVDSVTPVARPEEPPADSLAFEETSSKPLEKVHKAPKSTFAEIQNVAPSPPGPVQREVNRLNWLATQPAVPPVVLRANAGLANFEPQIFKYADFPKVVYDTTHSSSPCSTPIPFPGTDTFLPCPTEPVQRRSSLRPLVLPARVASRMSVRIGPIPLEEPERRSEAMEGIIALLDIGLATP